VVVAFTVLASDGSSVADEPSVTGVGLLVALSDCVRVREAPLALVLSFRTVTVPAVVPPTARVMG
jgi:hypothetical protein